MKPAIIHANDVIWLRDIHLVKQDPYHSTAVISEVA